MHINNDYHILDGQGGVNLRTVVVTVLSTVIVSIGAWGFGLSKRVVRLEDQMNTTAKALEAELSNINKKLDSREFQEYKRTTSREQDLRIELLEKEIEAVDQNKL